MLIRPFRPQDKSAILAIQRQQLRGWFNKEPSSDALADLDSPLHVGTWVLEEDGKIVAAVGVKATVEIAMTLDMNSNPKLSELFPKLIKLWATVGVELHRKGYVDCMARIGPHIKKWGNTLIKRAGFERMKTETLWFDIEKWCVKDARRNES